MPNAREKRSRKEHDPTLLREAADKMHVAAIRLLRRLRKQDEAAGIGPAQLSALSVLVFRGPLMLGSLADAEQVRPPTMTRIVAALEREKLVTRIPDATDRRSARIQATAAGRKLMLAARDRRLADFMSLLAKLSNADVAAIRRAAELISGGVQD